MTAIPGNLDSQWWARPTISALEGNRRSNIGRTITIWSGETGRFREDFHRCVCAVCALAAQVSLNLRVVTIPWRVVLARVAFPANQRGEPTLTIRRYGRCLAVVYDRLYRDLEHPMALGRRVELTGITATVTALTADGRPAEAEYQFTVPLEHP